MPPAKLTCNGCGALVTVRSRATVFVVCEYCQSTLVRQDIKLEHYGQVADVPIAWSPLQIGTSGKIDGKPFTLIGRVWQGWDGGYWNEWLAQFDQGIEGWLAEAQGFYSLSYPVNASPLPTPDELRPGRRLTLQGGTLFTIVDVKQSVCLGVEGELPFPSPKGRLCLSADCSNRFEGFACIEYGLNGPEAWQKPRAYVGEYRAFDAFEFKHLRPLDDWAA